MCFVRPCHSVLSTFFEWQRVCGFPPPSKRQPIPSAQRVKGSSAGRATTSAVGRGIAVVFVNHSKLFLRERKNRIKRPTNEAHIPATE